MGFNIEEFIKLINNFKHPYFVIATILAIIQYIIHISGLDYLITYWLFGTHHFPEMLGMFFFGLWIGHIYIKINIHIIHILLHIFPWALWCISIISLRIINSYLIFFSFILFFPTLIGLYLILVYNNFKSKKN